MKVLISSSAFYNFTVGMFGPIYALFATNIGGDILTAGTAIAVYSGVIGVLLFIFGRIEDKVDKKKIFIIGRIVNVVGTAGYLFVANPVDLFIVQAILGIALAMMDPSFQSLYSRGLRKGHEASEWSMWEGTVYIVLAFAAVIGGVVATLFGFKALFAVMTATSIVSLILALFLTKDKSWNVFMKLARK